ncbi:hypothetical protein JCM13304A_02210 [Desulfothermus okinawensis JCM 13304]
MTVFEETTALYEQKGVIVKSGAIVNKIFIEYASIPWKRREESKKRNITWDHLPKFYFTDKEKDTLNTASLKNNLLYFKKEQL